MSVEFALGMWVYAVVLSLLLNAYTFTIHKIDAGVESTVTIADEGYCHTIPWECS